MLYIFIYMSTTYNAKSEQSISRRLCYALIRSHLLTSPIAPSLSWYFSIHGIASSKSCSYIKHCHIVIVIPVLGCVESVSWVCIAWYILLVQVLHRPNPKQSILLCTCQLNIRVLCNSIQYKIVPLCVTLTSEIQETFILASF